MYGCGRIFSGDQMLCLGQLMTDPLRWHSDGPQWQLPNGAPPWKSAIARRLEVVWHRSKREGFDPVLNGSFLRLASGGTGSSPEGWTDRGLLEGEGPDGVREGLGKMVRLMAEVEQSLRVGFDRLGRWGWRRLEGRSPDGRHEARVEPRLTAEGSNVRLILGKDVARWNCQ